MGEERKSECYLPVDMARNRTSTQISSVATYVPFKERRPADVRAEEASNIRQRFPSKVPVIVERYKKEKELPRLDRVKFLVPQELSVSQFVVVVRSRMMIRPSQSLHFIVGGKQVPSMQMSVAELYHRCQDEDNFLYMTYASTEMFG